MITHLSSTASQKLATLSCEKLLAITFTQLEGLLSAIQMGQVQQVLDLYYSYWLHRSVEITCIKLVSLDGAVLHMFHFGVRNVKFSKQSNCISVYVI
jgi:biotin-(acetyl-CoA carboxylase) ligase